MTDSLDKALDQVRDAFAEQREQYAELLENFDRLRALHRTLVHEAVITVEEEEWILDLLTDLNLDHRLKNSVVDKLKERKHVRQTHQHRD